MVYNVFSFHAVCRLSAILHGPSLLDKGTNFIDFDLLLLKLIFVRKTLPDMDTRLKKFFQSFTDKLYYSKFCVKFKKYFKDI